MPSARRVGTNENISTYGAGQTYAAGELSIWEAATDNDNVGTTTSPVLECLAAQYDDFVEFIGATNSATYFRIIRPKAGNFHSGVRDKGVQFYSTADSNVFAFFELSTQLQDLGVRLTINSGTYRSGIISSTGSGANVVIGCIVTACANVGGASVYGIVGDVGTGHIWVDSLWENNDFYSGLVNGSVTAYNCTAINNFSGFAAGSTGTLTTKNCLATGNTGAGGADFVIFGGTLNQSFNASGDATASGTGSRASQTFTFVNAGAFDYHLASNDAGAKGFGTDLSADGIYAFDDDINFQKRGSVWDIGFDQVGAFQRESFIKTQAVNRASTY